jgi:hypothetical protein
MILGQRLKNSTLQLGNKTVGAVSALGHKIIPMLTPVNNVLNTVNTVRKIYSNLEKLNSRKRLQ